MISKKIVLVGDFSTGKTSLIHRFVDNQFSDTYLSTIGVKISRKNISFKEETVQNIIWDIEGGTEKKPLNSSYLLGAHGAIIVADITRESSIESLKFYITLVSGASNKSTIVIALNKCDLLEENEAEKIIKKLQNVFQEISFITLTSAKNSKGVDALFEQLTLLMMS
jgi:small GTP-binding protein